MVSRSWALAIAGLAAAGTVVACSKESTTSTTATSSPGTTAPACAPTNLAVTGTDGSTTSVTGPTAYADLLVRNGRTGNVNIANYAIPKDEAYGVSEAGNLQPGQVLVSFALTPNSGSVDPGTYVPETSASTNTTQAGAVGKVTFLNISTGQGKQSPLAPVTVQITSVTQTQVCGTMTSSAASSGSTTTAGVSGPFTAERIYSGQADAAGQARDRLTTGTTAGGTGTTTGPGTSSTSSSATSTSTSTPGTSSTSTSTPGSSTSTPSSSSSSAVSSSTSTPAP